MARLSPRLWHKSPGARDELFPLDTKRSIDRCQLSLAQGHVKGPGIPNLALFGWYDGANFRYRRRPQFEIGLCSCQVQAQRERRGSGSSAAKKTSVTTFLRKSSDGLPLGGEDSLLRRPSLRYRSFRG